MMRSAPIGAILAAMTMHGFSSIQPATQRLSHQPMPLPGEVPPVQDPNPYPAPPLDEPSTPPPPHEPTEMPPVRDPTPLP